MGTQDRERTMSSVTLRQTQIAKHTSLACGAATIMSGGVPGSLERQGWFYNSDPGKEGLGEGWPIL